MAQQNESSTTEDLAKILFNEAMNITSIAHYARVQANDAELRARYCMSLAEKAVCEADAVHQVAESLTCTSKMVANMTLDYICSLFQQTGEENWTPKNVSSEERVMIDTLKQIGTRRPLHKTFHSNNDIDPFSCDFESLSTNCFEKSTEKYRRREAPIKTSPLHKDNGEESSYGILVDNIKFDQSNDVIEKFQEQFPESIVESKETPPKDLPKEFDSSHSLPILYEDSYQGHRGTKPQSWAEKKNIRKMQRKLREIDLDGNELDHISESSADNLAEIIDGRIQYNSPINKETLLKSVRFSDLSQTKPENSLTVSSSATKEKSDE